MDRTTANPTFQVTVLPSGRTFTVIAGETILNAGMRQGVDLPYGCKDGVCGSCKCGRLAGDIHHDPHHDNALSAAEAAGGMVLTCRAQPTSDVVLESRQVSAVDALPVKKFPVRVTSLEKLSSDVIVVKLQLPAHDLFRYHAGQYIEVMLPNNVRRSYSMANAPHTLSTHGLELHIRHTQGGRFTDHVFGAMQEREVLRVEGPFGSCCLHAIHDRPIVLLATGTGFAPIKALIEQLALDGMKHPVTLYRGGRRPADLYMEDWVRSRLDDLPWLSYVPVLSNAQSEDNWPGRTGKVHHAVLSDIKDLSAYQVFACGSPEMVESASVDLMRAGLPPHEFYADPFISEADKPQKPLLFPA